MNVNRTTLAVLLRFANDINEEISQVPLLNDALSSGKESGKGTEVFPNIQNGRHVMFHMKFGLNAFRINLIKEQKIFLQSALTNAAVEFDLFSDNTVSVAVSLAGLGVKDFYDTPWSCMLSTGNS